MFELTSITRTKDPEPERKWFNAKQVEMMRSEITDDEMMDFIGRNPGCTWVLSRPLYITGSHTVTDSTIFGMWEYRAG
jgi:hypothetical protein